MQTIKQWPEDERPREKLLRVGPKALTDAELLAIFLRTGIRGCNAVELSRQILSLTGGLRQLIRQEQTHFCQIQGLGPAKYVQLQAVMEMATRVLSQQLAVCDVIKNAEDAKQLLLLLLQDQVHEHFLILYLDNQHHVLGHETLFNGTIDGAAVYPRVVVEKVLNKRAAAVIFAHNHPSGIAEPSLADQQITSKLKQALALIDVRLLDHMIVGNAEVVSMAERGLV